MFFLKNNEMLNSLFSLFYRHIYKSDMKSWFKTEKM